MQKVSAEDFKSIMNSVAKGETPFRDIYSELFAPESECLPLFLKFCYSSMLSVKHLEETCPNCLVDYASMSFTLGFLMGRDNAQEEILNYEREVKEDAESH